MSQPMCCSDHNSIHLSVSLHVSLMVPEPVPELVVEPVVTMYRDGKDGKLFVPKFFDTYAGR